MAAKVGPRSKLHDFRDDNGEPIGYPVLIAATGLTRSAVANRLKCYGETQTDLRAFLQTALEFRTQGEFKSAVEGAEFTAELDTEKEAVGAKATLDELEIRIKEEKLRELEFKNERTEGKYVLLSDVQLALDNFLIGLRTNLESLPEQVVQSIMTCREEHEGTEILLEALRHLTRDLANNPIQIGEEDG